MLERIFIENIAIIEQCEIQFEKGFNLLTGETGAGKSIIIDAISAILGQRTPREIIRTGAAKATVEATFTGGLKLSRELLKDGRNLCHINEQPRPLADLKTLGDGLIHIFNQHQCTDLLDIESHLRILDQATGQEGTLVLYQLDYKELMTLKNKIQSNIKNEKERLRRIDSLQVEIAEIEEANLTNGEEDSLLQKKKTLQNHERIQSVLQQATTALDGSDEQEGLLQNLQQTAKDLSRLSGIDTELDNLGSTAHEAAELLGDFNYSIKNYLDNIAFSPETLEEIESRLDLIYRLKRKYGANIEEILETLQNARDELDALTAPTEDIDALKELYFQKKEALFTAATVISDARKEGAKTLEVALKRELSALNMPKVEMQIIFTPLDNLQETGIDAVQFLFSANEGEELKPLNKIASGGELSRIMLAVKNIVSDSIATLIFDEVDTGISGSTSALVGKKLKELAHDKQILCISHQSQMAAYCDAHFFISKKVDAGRTKTTVKKLDLDDRIKEMARMHEGDNPSPLAIDYAREQFEKAKQNIL